jgi:glycosyltransferase involved in cell wall biosynthesis
MLLEGLIRPKVLRRNIKHVSGLEELDYAGNEVIAVCIVRNGALHIQSFIDHHFDLGVKHIIFLDNCSTDETINIAAEYSNITILQSKCPYQTYENTMKRYMVQKFARNQWSLTVDIDERFDYPYSGQLPIGSFLTYLNTYNYTAVVTQMLDLFDANAITDNSSQNSKPIKETCHYYDISNIEKTKYPYGILSNSNVKMHWGGIRRTIFGTENGLTKASLILLDRKIKPFVDWHHARHARIADITCILLHYPFRGPFREKVNDAVRTGRYGKFTTREYKKYWQILKQNPTLTVKLDAAQKFKDIETLVNAGFILVSDAYLNWVERHSGMLKH